VHRTRFGKTAKNSKNSPGVSLIRFSMLNCSSCAALASEISGAKLEVSFDPASARIALEEKGLFKCKLENA
jgi:hypothetical protein